MASGSVVRRKVGTGSLSGLKSLLEDGWGFELEIFNLLENSSASTLLGSTADCGVDCAGCWVLVVLGVLDAVLRRSAMSLSPRSVGFGSARSLGFMFGKEALWMVQIQVVWFAAAAPFRSCQIT